MRQGLQAAEIPCRRTRCPQLQVAKGAGIASQDLRPHPFGGSRFVAPAVEEDPAMRRREMLDGNGAWVARAVSSISALCASGRRRQRRSTQVPADAECRGAVSSSPPIPGGPMQAGRRADRLGITRQGAKRVTGSHAVSDRAEAPHTVVAGVGHNGAGIDNRHLHRGRRVGRLIQRAAPRRAYCPRRRALAGSRRSRVARSERTCHRSRRATRTHPYKR